MAHTGKVSVQSSRGCCVVTASFTEILTSNSEPAQPLPQDPLQARLPAEEWHGNVMQSCEVSSFPSTCQLQLELVKMSQTIFPLTGFLLIYGWSSPEFPLLSTPPFPLESFLSQPRVCKHTHSLLHSLLGMPQGNDPQAQILAVAMGAAFITHIPTGPCFSLCWCSPIKTFCLKGIYWFHIHKENRNLLLN